jgi:hypothetical protein
MNSCRAEKRGYKQEKQRIKIFFQNMLKKIFFKMYSSANFTLFISFHPCFSIQRNHLLA